MPGQAVPHVGMPGIDKLVHFGMFAILTLCFYFEYNTHKRKLPHFIYTFLMLGGFGLITEVMQIFADSRSFDLKDLAVDVAGVLIASSVFIVLERYHK